MTSSIILLVLLGVGYVLGHGNHGHAPPVPGATPPPANTMGFHDTSLTQDEAHIKEHLKDEIDVTKKMTPQELEFHYFRLHDTNNDTKLDGLEIMAALSHIQHMFEIQPQEKQGKTEAEIEKLQAERKAGSLQYFADVIDNVLKDDDFNHDGYISYPEYMSARKRDYIKQQQQMAHHNEVNMQQQAHMQQQQYQQYMQWQQQQQQHQQQQQIGGNVQQFQQNPQQFNQQQPQQQQQLQYKPNQQQQQQQQQYNPNQQQQFQQPQQHQQFQQPAAAKI